MNFRIKGLVVVAVALGSLGIQASETDHGLFIEVVGQDNIAVDRANLQAAIDAAPDGATVHLTGVFQLDGRAVAIYRSHLTVAGVAHGTGRAVLKGLLGPLGRPIGDLPLNSPTPNTAVHFNRGILVASVDGGVTEDVTLRGFSMTGFHRGVAVQSFAAETNLCDAPNFGVEARDVRIEDLRMDNVTRGLQTFGAVRNLRASNNEVSGAISDGILLNSGNVVCFAADGTAGNFVAGSLVGAEIRNNTLLTADIASLPQPFNAVGPSTDVLVVGNTFDGGAAAAHLNGAVANFVVRNNVIANGGSQGNPSFRFGGFRMTQASGFAVTNNRYSNNLASDTLPSTTLVPRDVWLMPVTTGNTITEGKATIVFDTGTGNTVAIRGS
jgi:hypothetical protein